MNCRLPNSEIIEVYSSHTGRNLHDTVYRTLGLDEGFKRRVLESRRKKIEGEKWISIAMLTQASKRESKT